MISVYDRLTEIQLGQRRIETLDKYVDVIQMGRKNPVWFIEKFYDVQLTDYQKWLIMSAWTKSKVCFVCSRNTGKSFVAGIYVMARSDLFPSMQIWIASNTSKQSQSTFQKIEDISKHNIQSIHNNNCIFAEELTKPNGSLDGFTHGESWKFELYNQSRVKTLAGGSGENVVGMRSNLTVFDEAAVIPDEFFARVEPFTTQDSSFATGAGVDLEILPKNLPNQTLYLSSAGDTSGHLYQVYKDCAKHMAMGFDDCFVADINCEIPLHPTINGNPYPPLFNRAEVETMLRTNKYRAFREYYNIFDQSGGLDSVIGRDQILRNTFDYLPVYRNRDPDALYGIFYDPAHQADNSFVLVAEYTKDKLKGWVMRLINGINLVQTLSTGEKKPMIAIEQLAWFRQILVDYNGEYEEYTKIHAAIDPGAGGGGLIYSDFLLEDWQDSHGRWHRGLLSSDVDNYNELEGQYPHAVKEVLSLPTASKWKNEQFAAAQQMVDEDLVMFPPVPRGDEVDIDGETVVLTPEDLRALIELDLLKEELVMMRKIKTESGNVKYQLAQDSARSAHDDRAYTFSMACWYLSYLRRKDQFDSKVNWSEGMASAIAKVGSHAGAGSGGLRSASNPFSGKKNPWTNRR